MDKRTNQQNKALHTFFQLLSDELNTQGLDARVVLKPTYKIWWTADSIKRDLFCQLSKAMFNKEHTSDLTKKEVDKVYEQLMFILGEKFGVYVEFPAKLDSFEQLLNNK